MKAMTMGGPDGGHQSCVGEYGSGVIGVDCSKCGGKQELSDRRCLLGVLALLARHPSTESIELTGVWEVRYDAVAVSALLPLAKIFASLGTLGASLPEGGICRQCEHSPSSMANRLLERFPAKPVLDAKWGLELGPRGEGCEDCINRTKAAVTAASQEFGNFESSLTRRIFKVVGGGPDADHRPEEPGAKIQQ